MTMYGDVVLGGICPPNFNEYKSSILFSLDREPKRMRAYFFNDWDVDITSNAVIAKSKTQYTKNDIFENGRIACEKALDLFAAEGHGAYCIVEPHHRNIELYFENNQYMLQINDINDISMDVDIQTTILDKDGNEIPTPTVAQPPWETVYRYYRFSQTSNNMYDAYRWMYLVFEILMQNIAPINLRPNGKPSEQEKSWIDRALRLADTKHNWSTRLNWDTSDPVKYFLSEQYDGTRCNLFHSKGGRLLPNDSMDSQHIHKMLIQLKGLCEYLMYKLYPIGRNRGVITYKGFNLLMKSGFKETRAFISDKVVDATLMNGNNALDNPLIILNAEENFATGQLGIEEYRYISQVMPDSKYTVKSYGISQGKDVLIVGGFGGISLFIEGIHNLSISVFLRLMNRGDSRHYDS